MIPSDMDFPKPNERREKLSDKGDITKYIFITAPLTTPKDFNFKAIAIKDGQLIPQLID